MRWAGQVAYIGEIRTAYKVAAGNLNGRGRLGDPEVRGRIILKLFVGGCGLDSLGSG
jgi:hypothetical protein